MKEIFYDKQEDAMLSRLNVNECKSQKIDDVIQEENNEDEQKEIFDIDFKGNFNKKLKVDELNQEKCTNVNFCNVYIQPLEKISEIDEL